MSARRRFLRAAAIAASVVALIIGAMLMDAFAQDAPLTLDQLQAMAIARNPTLTQVNADVEAARGRARQAGAFPNPIVGYTGEEISGGPIVRGGEHGFFVEQTLPISGKRGLSRATFEREAAQAEAMAETQRLRVLNTVRVRFYQALLAEQQVEVTQRLANVATETVAISKQSYNVGTIDRPDVLQAEIEEQRARLQLAAAKSERERVWQRLAVAVGDATLARRPLAGSAETPPVLDRDQVLARLLRESPELKVAQAGLARGDAALRRERREPAPDLVVRAGPRYNRELLESSSSGTLRPVGWEAAIEVGVTVPLFTRNQGGIAAAQAERTRADAEVKRLELDLRARLADVFEMYDTARQSAVMYRTEILPRAEQAYQLYMTRYHEMAVAYPQVLVAQQTFVQAHREYLATLETAWRTAIQLEGFLLDEERQ